MEATFMMIAKTFAGLEEVLAKELETLGAQDIKISTRAVSFEGDTEFMYKANLELRTALSVLKPVHSFKAEDEDELYDFLRNKVDWEEYMDLMDTFSIDAVVNSTIFTHSQYIRHKTKDGITDFFKAKYRRRPHVEVENPHVVFNIHIHENECTLSLDSSGADSLNKRGYRTEANTAPLNEVLAAGLLLLSNWDKETPFLDPMCGSGTILIEAALLANNIAPNSLRKQFGFTQWKNFDRKLWRAVRRNAKAKEIKNPVEIFGADVSEEFIEIAERNIERANLKKQISIDQISFQQTEAFEEKGFMLINPPYGERLGDDQEDINELYQEIGDTLKTYYPGYETWIISSNDEAFKNIGLKTSKKIPLFNGALTCSFNQYKMYEGTEKAEENEI